MGDLTDPSLIFWPGSPMARFGQNPYGENLYRVIWGPSRQFLVHGQWNEAGIERSKWAPLYPHVGEMWILERWKDPWLFAGCTKASWDMSPLSTLGPYPDRGEYDLSHVFSLTPSSTNVEAAIAALEAGRNYSQYENSVAIRENHARDKAHLSSQRQALAKNALPAFGAAAMSGSGGGRGTKTMPVIRSANELRLPLKHHFGVARKLKQRHYEVPVQIG